MPAPPNIILILSDDQSYSSIAKMPYMSTRTGWYRFSNAYCNNPTCSPSRATILSGLWSHHHGVESTGGAPPFHDESTLATWLQTAGYYTGLVGKYHLGSYKTIPQNYVPPGWNEWVEQEMNNPDFPAENSPYYNYLLNINGVETNYGANPEEYSTTVFKKFALDFITRAAAGQPPGDVSGGTPFYLHFAPRAPHNNWTAAPGDIGHFSSEIITDAPNFNEADMSDKPAWWRGLNLVKKSNMDGARRKEWDTLLELDRACRDILTLVNNLRIAGRTIVIYTTDNPYAYGEHRWSGKIAPYEESTKIPMLIKYLGQNQGFSWPHIISNVDIAPTIADLATTVPGAPVDGHSFARFLRFNLPPTDWTSEALLHAFNNASASELPGQGNPPTFWGVRVPGYKYVESPITGEVELYDMVQDPYEMQSVAGVPPYAGPQAELAAKLAEMKARPPR